MAFTDRRPDTHRITKAIAVGAFQAAVIYGLVAGLAVKFEKKDKDRFWANDYTVDVALPPPPEKPLPETTEAVNTPPPIPPEHTDDFGFQQGQTIDFPIFTPKPLPLAGTIGVPPLLPTKPKVTPAGPVPRNNRADWVTTVDYPSRDLRERNEGTSRFQLTVDAKGKVQDCRIIGSSGHSGLDEATCDKVSRRARFDPATDGSGDKVGGSYTGTVRWVIPGD